MEAGKNVDFSVVFKSVPRADFTDAFKNAPDIDINAMFRRSLRKRNVFSRVLKTLKNIWEKYRY